MCVWKVLGVSLIEGEQSGTSRFVCLAPHPLIASPVAASLLLSPGTKNVLNARRLLQCQITKGKVEGWRLEREMTNQGKLGLTQLFIF